MDNQPQPIDVVSCSKCFFSRVVRVAPNSLEKVRVCKWGPPVPIVAMTQTGPIMLPSSQPPVMDGQWCFQFREAESLAEISNDAAPKYEGKLLESDTKSILAS